MSVVGRLGQVTACAGLEPASPEPLDRLARRLTTGDMSSSPFRPSEPSDHYGRSCYRETRMFKGQGDQLAIVWITAGNISQLAPQGRSTTLSCSLGSVRAMIATALESVGL